MIQLHQCARAIRPRRLAPPVALLLGVLLPACQKDDLLRPGERETNVLTAVYETDAQFLENPIEINGEVKEREWGGALSADHPFHQVRLTRDDGVGDPGEPIYVSVKCIYTDSDIYFLFQWADGRPDEMKDATTYFGPNISPTDSCGAIAADLLNEFYWTRRPGGVPFDEDRLAVAFEVTAAGDSKGNFRDQGCLTACHDDHRPRFGSVEFGRLDVWQWLSTRTNPVRDLYNRLENPFFPLHGVPAYLEDYNADAVGGLVPDPGTPCWRQNWVGNSDLPYFVYRKSNDLDYGGTGCINEFHEECRPNNGVPLFYITRDNIVGSEPQLSCMDAWNEAPLPAGTEKRPWIAGDIVTGYWYTYATGSRADVRGKGQHEEELGRWSLEVARPLATGDPSHDITFSGDPGDEVAFAIAVSDNSSSVHWGSGPQILRFGPKPTAGSAAVGRASR